MTDPATAERTYIEPLTWRMLEKIIAKERPDALLPTLGGQTALNLALDLERHGGRKPAGVCARILQRLLALTAAIWHNETTRQPGPARSLLAYDH